LTVVIHGSEYGIQPAVSLLGLLAVSLDPGSHEVEHLGFQVPRAALRILAATDQSGVFQHLEVLRHSLHRHVVRGGELAYRGVPGSEPGDDVTPCGVGQGGEGS
jgi:hypothetical protein